MNLKHLTVCLFSAQFLPRLFDSIVCVCVVVSAIVPQLHQSERSQYVPLSNDANSSIFNVIFHYFVVRATQRSTWLAVNIHQHTKTLSIFHSVTLKSNLLRYNKHTRDTHTKKNYISCICGCREWWNKYKNIW